MVEVQPLGGEERRQRAHLVQDDVPDILGKELHPPMPDPDRIRQPGLHLHGDPRQAGFSHHLVHADRVAGVEAAGHVRGVDQRQQPVVVAEGVDPDRLTMSRLMLMVSFPVLVSGTARQGGAGRGSGHVRHRHDHLWKLQGRWVDPGGPAGRATDRPPPPTGKAAAFRAPVAVSTTEACPVTNRIIQPALVAVSRTRHLGHQAVG